MGGLGGCGIGLAATACGLAEFMDGNELPESGCRGTEHATLPPRNVGRDADLRSNTKQSLLVVLVALSGLTVGVSHRQPLTVVWKLLPHGGWLEPMVRRLHGVSHLHTNPSFGSTTSPTRRKPHLVKTRVEALGSGIVCARTTRTCSWLKA